MLAAYDHSKVQFPDGYIYPYNVWDYVRPSFFCPYDLERVGTLGDGGKWVCGMTKYEEHSHPTNTVLSDGETVGSSSRPLIIYSFGVNDDSSFEAAFLRRTNAEIWGYDYSVADWAHQITPDIAQRAHFTQAGIARTSNINNKPPFYSIHDLMQRNNHTYIDVMKMDIEGAEFDAISSLVSFVSSMNRGPQIALPIGQLLIELHFMDVGATLTKPQDMQAWLEWWRALERLGFRQVNNEDNWIGDNGPGKPRFMEYTLINVLGGDRNVLLP